MDDYKNSREGRAVARKYADILPLQRPCTEESLRKHPRMTLENRAKIFSPFAALRGYSGRLDTEAWKSQRVPRRELSEEETLQLNGQLNRLQKGMAVRAVVFSPDGAAPEGTPIGFYAIREGTAEQVDPVLRQLRIAGEDILFNDLMELTVVDPKNC